LDRCGKGRARSRTGKIYRIVVRNEIGGRFALAFEEMEMETRSGCTILKGEVVDQSHLHGILDRIGALGLELLSVESCSAEGYDNDANHSPAADPTARRESEGRGPEPQT
jgi:hypothetical protein